MAQVSIQNILSQPFYAAAREQQKLLAAGFKKGLSAPEQEAIGRILKQDRSEVVNVVNDSKERMAFAKALLKKQAEFALQKAGVTSQLGFNFYDLRGPVQLLYPVNTPFRNRVARKDRVNDGVGTAAHWQSNRNPGYVYAGVLEGMRGAIGTPDVQNYIASYKELGSERAVTYTAQFAGEGYADNVADEHIRGLQTLWLQEESLLLMGNSGNGSGNNGFALGVAPTPTVALGTGASSLAASTNVSVAVVLLSALGNPQNAQYGYGAAPSVLSGLTPKYTVNLSGGGTQVVNGGTSAISAMSEVISTGAGEAPVVASVPKGQRGVFGYAWFVDTTDSGSPSLANAKLYAITTTPSVTINAAPAGTQTGAAANLNVDCSYNTTDFDGLLTYAANSGMWVDLGGASLTSGKDGTVAEVESMLDSLFTAFQTGVTDIWGSPDAILNLSKAIRYTGTSASGYQIVLNRDTQNNILGGYVVSGYQSRYAINSPTGANVIPLRIHPMLPAGTLFFDVNTIPYPNSRSPFPYGLLMQRDFYGIEWPIVSRQWVFGTYVHEVLAHNFPWLTAVITGIGNFVGN
jgi:hypothetical protein